MFKNRILLDYYFTVLHFPALVSDTWTFTVYIFLMQKTLVSRGPLFHIHTKLDIPNCWEL